MIEHYYKTPYNRRMLWFLAFHIIAVVCWFAGLFYLPRLFVYHAMATEQSVKDQLKIMEYKLYHYIMMPAAAVAVIFGLALWLPRYTFYSHAMWLHIKLILVLVLIAYHFYCGKLVREFSKDQNTRSHKFYRYFNEVPTVILIAVVLLAVLKP